MKIQKVSKRLMLNKSTVSNLEMKEVNGGVIITGSYVSCNSKEEFNCLTSAIWSRCNTCQYVCDPEPITVIERN